MFTKNMNSRLAVFSPSDILFLENLSKIYIASWKTQPCYIIMANWPATVCKENHSVDLIIQWCQVEKTAYFLPLCQHSAQRERGERERESGKVRQGTWPGFLIHYTTSNFWRLCDSCLCLPTSSSHILYIFKESHISSEAWEVYIHVNTSNWFWEYC